MKFLRTLIEANKPVVDITQRPTRQQIEKAWHEGVMYKGLNVFDTVYETEVDNAIQSHLKRYAESERVRGFDAQESYLGYVPSKDMFVMGFDTWGEKDDPYNEQNDEDEVNIPHVVSFKLDENGRYSKGVVRAEFPGRMTYPNTYKLLHKQFPDIIDIRLD